MKNFSIHYNLKSSNFFQKDNILLSPNGAIIYAYEISPIPVMNETIDVLEATASKHKEFFKRLNLSLEIVTMSQKPNIQEIKDYYENNINETFKEVEQIGIKIANNMLEKIPNMSENQHYYIFALENNNDFKTVNPIKNFLLNSGLFNEKTISKKQAKTILKNALVSSEVIEELLNSEFGGFHKLQNEELSKVLHRMRSTLGFEEYISGSISTKENIDHLHHQTQKLNDDEIIEYNSYEQYFMVEKMPDSNEANNFFTQIQYSGVPITFYYKLAFRSSDKTYKDMLSQQRQIKKDIKKYRLEYGRDSQEYQRAYVAASTGVKEFELTDDSSVNIQICFRIHANSLEDLKDYCEKAISYFKRIGISINLLKGQQLKFMDHILPFNCNDKKHQFFNLNYLSNMNIFGGSDVGDKVGHIFFKNTLTNEPVMLDFSKLMSGKAKSTSALTMIYGESGSGKSMLSYLLFMQMLTTAGFPILKINPKNDEQNIGKNQPWLNDIYQNIILGSSNDQKGVLDPFLVHSTTKLNKENIRDIKDEVKKDILKIMKTLSYREINLSLIDFAIDEMIENKTKLNMKNLALTLKQSRKSAAFGDGILALEQTRLGYLMVADDESKFSLDFSKYFTVLTFHKFPIISEYNDSDLEHVVANMLLSKTSAIVQKFADYWKKPGFMIIDEYYIWKQYPQGKATVDKMARIIRSLNKHMFIMTQNVSDDEDDKLQNNTAMTLIGTLASKEEIEKAKKRFSLSNSLVSKLEKKLERATLKVSNQKKNYDFILIDYDKKRGVVQSVIPDKNIFLDYTQNGDVYEN